MGTRRGPSDRYPRRALRTLAAFGLTVDDVRIDRESRRVMDERATRLAERTLASLPMGRIAVITGPSGAGKSTMLRALGDTVRQRGGRVVEVGGARMFHRSRRRSIDLVACAIERRTGKSASEEAAMRLLAGAGLADARLAVMPASDLSEGERARLSLAIAMGLCAGAAEAVLLADEFGASLDAVTAVSVATGLTRWIAQQRARAVLVTHSQTTLRALRPRVVVRLRSGWIHAGPMRDAA